MLDFHWHHHEVHRHLRPSTIHPQNLVESIVCFHKIIFKCYQDKELLFNIQNIIIPYLIHPFFIMGDLLISEKYFFMPYFVSNLFKLIDSRALLFKPKHWLMTYLATSTKICLAVALTVMLSRWYCFPSCLIRIGSTKHWGQKDWPIPNSINLGFLGCPLPFWLGGLLLSGLV